MLFPSASCKKSIGQRSVCQSHAHWHAHRPRARSFIANGKYVYMVTADSKYATWAGLSRALVDNACLSLHACILSSLAVLKANPGDSGPRQRGEDLGVDLRHRLNSELRFKGRTPGTFCPLQGFYQLDPSTQPVKSPRAL